MDDPLTIKQKESLLDILDALTIGGSIHGDLLLDETVIQVYLKETEKIPEMAYRFFKQIPMCRLIEWTMKDYIQEETLCEYHIKYGFDITFLVQWLRGLSFDARQFFIEYAKKEKVLNLDFLEEQAKVSLHEVDGVYIESIPTHFDSLETLVTYGLTNRISLEQCHTLMADYAPSETEVNQVVSWLLETHEALKKISKSDQIRVFHIFCIVSLFLESPGRFHTGVHHVFDQLMTSIAMPKVVAVLNRMPYSIIESVLRHQLDKKHTAFIEYLNKNVPSYTFGAIRKIVRRGGFELNY